MHFYLNGPPLRSNTKHISRTYLIINWAFAVILAGIFVYAAMYDPDRGNPPLPSAYQAITGEETVSTGLSRSFSALVRFRLDDAREFNPYGPRIFLFFGIQLVLRIFLLFMTLRGILQIRDELQTEKWLILSDAAQSFVLFVICFWPFIRFWMDMLKIS